MTFDAFDDERRAELVARMLQEIMDDPIALMRLHEIERAMVSDLQQQPIHRRCNKCLRLVRALYRKAKGVDYREDAADETSRRDRDDD